MAKTKNALKKAGKTDNTTSSKSKKVAKPKQAKMSWLKDERTRKVAGGAMLAIGVFILVSCLSYAFNWKHDQALLNLELSDVTQQDPVKNLFGRLGAKTGNWFMFDGFGWAALLLPLLLMLYGTKLLVKQLPVPLFKWTRLGLVAMIWISLALGFFSTSYTEATDGLLYAQCDSCPGGTQGLYMTSWLKSKVGALGIVTLLVLSLGIFSIIQFNPKLNFASIGHWFKNRKKEDEDHTTEESTTEPVAVEKKTPAKSPLAMAAEKEEVQTTDAADEALQELMGDLHLETEAPTEVAIPESPQALEIELDNNTSETEAPVESSLELETSIPQQEAIPEVDKDLEIEEVKEEQALTEDELDGLAKEFGEYDPKLDLSRYELPTIDMLETHGAGNIQIDKEELEKNKNNIVATLNNYNIEISKIKATIGPTVTLYEIVPAPGVRISKIKNLEDDIALSLAALGIRIIAPIPGRGTIGIEVPNSNADIVSMRSLISSDKFQNSKMELPVALGKTISNETLVADLAKMPHLLMAGATGQGKSVGLNAILVSLLYKKHPSQIKFVLVDPKKVELTLFNKIERHFLAKLPGDDDEAIITDTSKVVTTLNSLCKEMDDRYELLKLAQCRNLKEYNAKFIKRKLNPENGHRYLPYIILVVDEFADLIMTAGKEVETPIARLAQLARAIGIHLIIATQRPSVNIITGTIKANFPARIAFRVTSKIDSRTILDAGGADQLIGRGDMLFSTGSDIIRIQCGFVDTPEVEAICEYIGNQQGYPQAFLLPEVLDETSAGNGDMDISDRDALFRDAASVIVMHQQGSASLLQRKLKLGYNRAGRLIDQLEDAGIIGPFEGSKARKVLIPDEMSLEQLLSNE